MPVCFANILVAFCVYFSWRNVLWTTSENQHEYGDDFHTAAYFAEVHDFNAAWRDGDHIHEGRLGFKLVMLYTFGHSHNSQLLVLALRSYNNWLLFLIFRFGFSPAAHEDDQHVRESHASSGPVCIVVLLGLYQGDWFDVRKPHVSSELWECFKPHLACVADTVCG